VEAWTIRIEPNSSARYLRVMRRGLVSAWCAAMAAAAGCASPGKAPPFEWWADPLPAPPRAKVSDDARRIAVLVEHTGKRDDFKAFQRDVRRKHDRVNRREIPGFRAECRYLPKLADRIREELEAGLAGTPRFVVIERRAANKALKAYGTQWLDLRAPANAARVGRACGAELMLLVEITENTMKIVEAGRQTVGTQKEGPVRQTDVTVKYEMWMVDVAAGRECWRTALTRSAGYKLVGSGSMGHWYWPRDPLEFRRALRGKGITEYVLGALADGPVRDETPSENPWRQP